MVYQGNNLMTVRKPLEASRYQIQERAQNHLRDHERAPRYLRQHQVVSICSKRYQGRSLTCRAATVQAAVNAIRASGATSQTIAIPGNFWAHADDWLNGNNAPLLNVKDPATNDNSLLILDVHKYLDSDGSGQSRECTTK